MKKLYIILLAVILGVGSSRADISYVISGNFGTSSDLEFPMSKESDDKYSFTLVANTTNPQYIIKQINSDNPDNPAIVSVDTGHNYKDYENKGDGDYTATPPNPWSQKASWNASSVTKFNWGAEVGSRYKITILLSNNNDWVKVEKLPALTNFDDYYFYGDMNRWSYLSNKETNVVIKNADKKDVTDDVFPNGAPKYYNEKELKADWKFIPVDDAHKVADQLILPGSGWYYLSFKNLSDENNTENRLCGQFKITKGNPTEDGNQDNWGVSSSTSLENYYSNRCPANQVYALEKGFGKRNVPLDNNYIDNATLYFNPDIPSLYIAGTPVDTYVYYAVVDADDEFKAPKRWQMLDLSQEFYYANTSGFNDITGSSSFNIDGAYKWDKCTANDLKDTPYYKNGEIVYNGITLPYVYRRRIPTGATHRFPVEFNVWVSNDKGTFNFPPATLSCDDIWFVEANVMMYYRYDDTDVTDNLTWVTYNAFSKNYDNTGAIESYDYLFGGNCKKDDPQPLIADGNWGVAIKTTLTEDEMAKMPQQYRDKGYKLWWKTPLTLPLDFTSSSWAMFADSHGAVFPAERVRATGDALDKVEISGSDVFFVVPTSQQNPSILYSHLKGTASAKSHSTVQINAEFFDPTAFNKGEYNIINDTDKVFYNFDIYHEGKWIDGSGTEKTPQFSDKPYHDWKLDGDATLKKEPVEPGYYLIVVKARYRNQTYTATDIYPVFE